MSEDKTTRRQGLTEPDDIVISQRLKALRLKRGWTLKQVARGMGMLIQTYQKYEYAETMPSARVVRAFALFYRVSSDYILGLKDSEE